MMERVLENVPHPEQIPQRNIQKLEAMGRGAVEQLLRSPKPHGQS